MEDRALAQLLERWAATLDAFANETVLYGWSTQHVAPQRLMADDIRRTARELSR